MKFRSVTEIETFNRQRNNEAKGALAAGKGFARFAQPEKKSKVRQAVELGDAVSANVKKIMLG